MRCSPYSPSAAPRTWSCGALAAAAQVAAVALGAAVLLLRVPGIPPWDTVYAEDYFLFLPGALQHPWHLFVAFDGYVQLVPRLIAQLVTYLPLADAARGLAVVGALVAALCALFIFHASAGHIRSVTLRVLLASGVILLSSAPMEIADSGVNTLWYLGLAMFWAVLWRPRTPAGIAVAALVGFLVTASTSIVILFAPLLAMRLFVLRRPREHAVTAGWLAGCLLQVRFVIRAAVAGQSRLVGGGGPAFGRDNRWGNSLTFYLHDVVLRCGRLAPVVAAPVVHDDRPGHADRRRRAGRRPRPDHRHAARGPAVHRRRHDDRLRLHHVRRLPGPMGRGLPRHLQERGGGALHGAAHHGDRGLGSSSGLDYALRKRRETRGRHAGAARPYARTRRCAGRSRSRRWSRSGGQLGGRLPVLRHPHGGVLQPVVAEGRPVPEWMPELSVG